MKIRVYIAAPWSERSLAKEAAEQFRAADFEVCSQWIDAHADKTSEFGLDFDIEVLKKEAVQDVEDVLACHIFVLLNTQERGKETSGKAVETGVALITRKPIIVVGEDSNIFHKLCHKATDVADAIKLIRTWEEVALSAQAEAPV